MELKQQVLRSCRYLLIPVVRFLLRHGVTWSEFGELSKEVYVKVARDDYGLEGRPTNNSRVAMLTGLSRREVARVRDHLLDGDEPAGAAKGDRISRILTGWHVDDEFTDDEGRPAELPLSGVAGSLSSLLKKYAGDLPHVAIRKEMRKRGLIEDRPGGMVRVLKRDYVYSDVDADMVHRMGVALHDHAATLEHNLNDERKSAPHFEAIADNAHVTPRAARAFQKLVESRGLAFLEEIDSWLSEHEIDSPAHTKDDTIRLGVGVYLIQDDDYQGTEQ